jgi:hypothetical protein
MPPTTTHGFLDQTIGRLVYAIIPLNIFLTIGYGATSWDTHRQLSISLCLLALVLLVLFWGIGTVRLVARRRRKALWRLVALAPPMAILIAHAIIGNESIAFLVWVFLVWLLASFSLAFVPAAASRLAVHDR